MGLFGVLVRIWELIKALGTMLSGIWGWIAAGLGFAVTAETTEIASKSIRVAGMVAWAIVSFGLLLVAFQALLSGLSVTLPAGAVQWAGAILPSNSSACLSALVTAFTTRFFYDWHLSIASKLAD